MGKSSAKLFCHIRRLEFETLYPPYSHSAFIKPTPMFPHPGRESRQVMSPNHDLLPAHCTTASTRVLSKELSVKSFSSPSAPEEGLSQGSPLRTVPLESENSFTHLPSPQGVCHSVFSTHVQSLDSTEQADRWNLHNAFARATDDTQHNTLTTFTTQSLPLHCAVLRQELAAAQFALTNCEFLAASPLPLQSTSTSSPLCSSLRSEKFALCNSSSHSHAPIVSEKTTEQKQDTADSTHELQCHRHLQANVSERTSIPPILASSLIVATGMDPVLPNNDFRHRHSLGNPLDFASGLDPVLPLNTSHGMRVGSIDCIQRSKPLPQSPRVTRKSTGESLTTALTRFASTCDADLPYIRDPTRPFFAPESALSTYSPLLVFPHHTAEEPLGVDESTFSTLRGASSSMTETVHEWFKSAATSLHTWSSHVTSDWHSAAGFAETSPAQETLTQTHRIFTMGMPTIGCPLPPQSESLNLTCGVSTMGTPINGNPLQSRPLTVESTSGYDYSICHLSSHRISSLAVNARHAIGSQELIRTTADHNSEETRLHVLSSDLATRKVFANNLDIEESLPSSRMTTNVEQTQKGSNPKGSN